MLYHSNCMLYYLDIMLLCAYTVCAVYCCLYRTKVQYCIEPTKVKFLLNVSILGQWKKKKKLILTFAAEHSLYCGWTFFVIGHSHFPFSLIGHSHFPFSFLSHSHFPWGGSVRALICCHGGRNETAQMAQLWWPMSFLQCVQGLWAYSQHQLTHNHHWGNSKNQNV